MIIYKTQGGLDFVRERESLTAPYSFGNMGFSSSQCSKSLVEWDRYIKMQIQCQRSTQIDAVLDSGIILSKAFPGGADRVFSTCSLSDEIREDEDHLWMQHFDREKFAASLLRQCEGKSLCNPEFYMRDIANSRIQQVEG